MALFNKAGAEEKSAEKEAALMRKFGLDGMSNPADVESVRKIVNELVGTGIMEFGLKLSSIGSKTEDILPPVSRRAEASLWRC